MGTQNQAKLKIRVLARIIDIIVFATLSFVLSLSLNINFSSTSFLIFLYLVYNIIFLLLKGQTIGKIIFGIRLLKIKNGISYFWQVFIREFIVFIILYSSQIYSFLLNNFSIPEINPILFSVISFMLLIIDILPFASGLKDRMVHDDIVNTTVVEI